MTNTHATAQTPDQQADVYVVRHAQSIGQVNPGAYLIPGDHAMPLTLLGHAQAKDRGINLRRDFDAADTRPVIILHSTSMRTTQTAEEILPSFPGATIAPDERLDKQKFGRFNGHFTESARREADPEGYTNYINDLATLGPFNVRPPEGESIADVRARVQCLLQEIKDTPARYILVTHGLPYLCAQAIQNGYDTDWILARQDTIKNCETAHLPEQTPALDL